MTAIIARIEAVNPAINAFANTYCPLVINSYPQ